MSPPLDPRFEYRDGFLLAGLRRTHDPANAAESLRRQWSDFLAEPLPAHRLGEHRYGVMCGVGPDGFEYMTAVQVASFEDLPAETGRMRVQPQRYAIVQHLPPRPLEGTWKQIFGWLHGGPFRSAHKPDFELYGSDDDPTSPIVAPELWVAVVPAGV